MPGFNNYYTHTLPTYQSSLLFYSTLPPILSVQHIQIPNPDPDPTSPYRSLPLPDEYSTVQYSTLDGTTLSGCIYSPWTQPIGALGFGIADG